MAFTVEDFQDLMRLLAARPEWRAELRRLLLPDEVLELPTVVRQLADEVRLLIDAQRRTESLVATLVEAQSRAEERIGHLEEGQARLEAAMARLAEAQERTEARVGTLEAAMARLAEAQERTEARVGTLEAAVARLAEAQERTEARVGTLEAAMVRLAEAQVRTEERLGRVEERVSRLEDGQTRLEAGQVRLEAALSRTDGRVANLRGGDLERRYRDHASGYFGRIVRRARVVSAEELDDLLDEGLASGVLDDDGAHEVRLADLVVRGRRSGEEQETFLVVEVSGVVEPADVERAARRAALLGRIRPTLAVVGGEEITPEAIDLAGARAVRRLENGRHVSPTTNS